MLQSHAGRGQNTLRRSSRALSSRGRLLTLISPFAGLSSTYLSSFCALARLLGACQLARAVQRSADVEEGRSRSQSQFLPFHTSLYAVDECFGQTSTQRNAKAGRTSIPNGGQEDDSEIYKAIRSEEPNRKYDTYRCVMKDGRN